MYPINNGFSGYQLPIEHNHDKTDVESENNKKHLDDNNSDEDELYNLEFSSYPTYAKPSNQTGNETYVCAETAATCLTQCAYTCDGGRNC